MALSVRFFLLLFILPVFLFGQHEKDSLSQRLNEARSLVEKADILHLMVSAQWDHNFEKALQYAEESYDLSRQVKYRKGIIVSLSDIGLYHFFKGNISKAIFFYQRALREAKNSNYGDYPAQTMTRIGNAFRTQSNFDSARLYYKKAFRLLAQKSNIRSLSFVYYNYGNLCNALSLYDSAFIYLHKSLLLRENLGDSVLIAESLRNLGMVHKNIANYDSAQYCFDIAYGVAKRYGDNELKMSCLIYTGELLAVRGDYSKAVILYTQALDLLKDHDFKLYFAMIYLRIAQIYDGQGEYARAIEYFFKAYDIETLLGNKQGQGRLQGYIGWTYLNQGNDTLAYNYAKSSLVTSEKIKDKEGVAYANNLIGYIYFKRKQYDQALKYFQITRSLREDLKSVLGVAFITYNIARLYERTGETLKGIEYCEKASAVFNTLNNRPAVLLTYNLLGLLHTRNKNYPAAHESLEKARILALQLPSPARLRDCYNGYIQFYEAQSDYVKTVYYYKKLVALNDSIFTSQSRSSRDQLAGLYQLEQKEEEIRTLQKQNQLHQAQILLQQSRIQWQNGFLLFTVTSIVMLLILAYTLLKYYRSKTKANKTLEKLYNEIIEQKEEIQAQSEELMEANQTLRELNHNILEKQEEIQAQSEELREANDTISEINTNLERLVNKRTLQLTEAYKELDTFFYRSSHDFRRPLTTFLGLAEVANITVRDKNALELFSKVKETAINLDKMLVKLQSISDVGANQLIFKNVLFNEIFHTVCDGFRTELQKKNIKAHFEMKTAVEFNSYPAMIKLITENMIENAIHFSNLDDPFVKLSVTSTDDEVILEFVDNGQGVEEEYKSRIFDMYFRANERSKGNGLGLYIVKKAVEKLDGSIVMKSTVQVGTTFTIRLPLRPV